jgi:hypothetical protein
MFVVGAPISEPVQQWSAAVLAAAVCRAVSHPHCLVAGVLQVAVVSDGIGVLKANMTSLTTNVGDVVRKEVSSCPPPHACCTA